MTAPWPGVDQSQVRLCLTLRDFEVTTQCFGSTFVVTVMHKLTGEHATATDTSYLAARTAAFDALEKAWRIER